MFLIYKVDVVRYILCDITLFDSLTLRRSQMTEIKQIESERSDPRDAASDNVLVPLNKESDVS